MPKLYKACGRMNFAAYAAGYEATIIAVTSTTVEEPLRADKPFNFHGYLVSTCS